MADEHPLQTAVARKALDELHDKPLNFGLSPRDAFTPERGWRIDEYRQPLPGEPPGPPLADGSWKVARRLVADYEFADPRIVHAVYHSDRPLAERDMLLRARFYGLTFHLRVRVGGVVDDTCPVDGRTVRVLGVALPDAAGAPRDGPDGLRAVEVARRRSGGVPHRLALAPGLHRQPLGASGFRLFGRHMQVKFARRACARIRHLTVAASAGVTGPLDTSSSPVTT